MLRPSPNHGSQRLPNDDDIYVLFIILISVFMYNTSTPTALCNYILVFAVTGLNCVYPV